MLNIIDTNYFKIIQSTCRNILGEVSHKSDKSDVPTFHCTAYKYKIE